MEIYSLPREDEEIAGAVRESLESRGIRVMTGVKVKALEQAEGKALVAVDNGKEVQKLEAEAVLVATGRRPNTAGLNLEAAGVEIWAQRRDCHRRFPHHHGAPYLCHGR